MKKIDFIVEKYLKLIEDEIAPVKKFEIGRHNHIADSEFDQEQLKKGIEVEKEHTDDIEIAKSIAKDHLSECKKYYVLLEKMEKLCKSKGDE